MRNSNPNNSNILLLLSDIQKRLDHSVFNGGFETLLKNIESIEASQKELVNEFRELNEVIYEPDTGLFSRIKKAETLYADEIKELQRASREMKKSIDSADGILEKYKENAEVINNLTEWKKSITRSIWAIASGAGLMLLKTFYDFLTQHIMFK